MPTAVLLSGGLDSAVLLADEAARGDVQPIYIGAGLAWESAERSMADALLRSDLLSGRTRGIVALSVDMRDVYAATHWAVTGTPPAYHTPDEDVYLPGRNIVLLTKAGVYCAAAGIDRIVLGTLRLTCFDATPEFRLTMARSLGLAHDLSRRAACGDEQGRVIRSRRGTGVPFELTLSHEPGHRHPAGPAAALRRLQQVPRTPTTHSWRPVWRIPLNTTRSALRGGSALRNQG